MLQRAYSHCEPWDGKQCADFARRFAAQFQAALHIIQDKYASLCVHLPSINLGASPAHPHPGIELLVLGFRSLATTPRRQVH
eukprot:6186641-Pleurochrysis_carterae.AAC.1